VCRPKYVEQLRNTGIINSTTRLYLVGSFYEIYFTMHCNTEFGAHVTNSNLKISEESCCNSRMTVLTKVSPKAAVELDRIQPC